MWKSSSHLLLCALAVTSTSLAADPAAVTVLSVQGELAVVVDGEPLRPLAANDLVAPDSVVATGFNSRAALDYGGLSVLRLGEHARIVVPSAPTAGQPLRITLLDGEIYIFNRRPTATVELASPSGTVLLEGTDLHGFIGPDRSSVISLISGRCRLTSVEGTLVLNPGEEGMLALGRPPVRLTGVDISQRIQWTLYYPAVLEPIDLPAVLRDDPRLQPTLAAYRNGNPIAALQALPEPVANNTTDAPLRAALLLAAGKVSQAQLILAGPSRGLAVESSQMDASSTASIAGLARSLEAHIATITQRGEAANNDPPTTATRWMVESFRRQTRNDLEGARVAAVEATRLAPEASYAWTRLAEVEFSFGRVGEARAALEHGLAFAPQNAQAVALEGFLLAATNDFAGAIQRFNAALDLDRGLGNAWLGRGLARFAQGDRSGGLDDLKNAAAQEPNRSILHSYLAKAMVAANLDELAANELHLAREKDPDDPTPWLYSALNAQRHRAPNAAVRDVLESITRNDNRALFRSRFLLDQDAGVRGTNLATIFQDAGLEALALGEAGRAVGSDPISASGHRFLAGAYDGLRDPYRINLRYETAWFNERLLANILAPVGSGNLSPVVSQGEYSRLFAQDGTSADLHAFVTEYHKRVLLGSVGSVHGRIAWSIDVDHLTDPGAGVNSDLDRTELYFSTKGALGEHDSWYVLVKTKNSENGDVAPRLRGTASDPDFRFREDQRPLIFAAWDHAWSPDQHTLLLASRIDNERHLTNDRFQPDVLRTNSGGEVVNISVPFSDLDSENRILLSGLEIRHVGRLGDQWVTGGIRYLDGNLRAQSEYSFLDPGVAPLFAGLTTHVGRERVSRQTGYLYVTRHLQPGCFITTGLTRSTLTFPTNLRIAPFATGTTRRSEWEPHAGFVWSATRDWRVRAAVSRVLGGFEIDDPIRLEPNEVAGFIHAYRSLAPEAVVGGRLPAERMDSASFSVDRRFGANLFLTAEAQHARSEASRVLGAYTFSTAPLVTSRPTASGFTQTFAFQETSLQLRGDRLIGETWSVGGTLAWQRACLDTGFPGWTAPLNPGLLRSDRRNASDLLQGTVRGNWQSRRGPFLRIDLTWWQQRRDPQRSAFEEVIANLEVGWRWPREQGEVALVILNVGDAQTGFDPVNYFLTPEPQRTVAMRARVRF